MCCAMRSCCCLAAVLLVWQAAVAAASDADRPPPGAASGGTSTAWCHYDRRSARLRDAAAGRCDGEAAGCFQFALMTVRLAAADGRGGGGGTSLHRALLNGADQSLRLAGHKAGGATVDAPYCWQHKLAAAFRAQCFEHIAAGSCGMTTLLHDDDTPVYLCCCAGDRCNAASVDDSFAANYGSGARYGTGAYYDARCLSAVAVPLGEFDYDDDGPARREPKAAQERPADGAEGGDDYDGYYVATVCLGAVLGALLVAMAVAGALYWGRSAAAGDSSTQTAAVSGAPQPQSPPQSDTAGSSVRSSEAADTSSATAGGDCGAAAATSPPRIGWTTEVKV